eukprot:TRINITY_DN108675_c0_g1_i1.p1 TRINITY_DN108675_c0_g1~~TRINITY_DN108675_c0_g1_i1.p1  ORF type:complete len:285 (-),score=78.61 TRINITY_DN108675_c0_g1_i1:363-1217(-)
MAPTLLKLSWPLATVFLLHVLGETVLEENTVEENDPANDEAVGPELTKEQLQALHVKIDADKDGKISLHEAMEYASKVSKIMAGKDIEKILEEMDTDKDGKLSLQEHLNDVTFIPAQADAEELKEIEQTKMFQTNKFKAADSDNDGSLGPKELPGLFFPETHPGVLEVAARETMRLKDSNKDGKISMNEFWELGESPEVQLQEAELRDFEEIDKDKSGSLDLEEVKAWESGMSHTESVILKLLEVCDKDGDKQCTLQELENSRETFSMDSHYQLLEWAEQGHEL